MAGSWKRNFSYGGLIALLTFFPLAQAKAFTQEQVEKAAAFLQEKGCISPVPKQFTAFHYEARGREQTVMKGRKPYLSSEQGKRLYLEALLSQNLDENGKYSFNLASDPVASASYGPGETSSWRLIAIDIPAQTRFLQPSACVKYAEDTKSLDSIIGKACSDALLSSADSKWTDHPECGPLKKAVFAKLHLAGIRFPWTHAMGGTKMDWCKGSDTSAFILSDGDWIQRKNFRFYDSSTSVTTENKQEREAIRQLACQFGYRQRSDRLQNSETECFDLFPPAGASGSHTPRESLLLKQETKDWMRENLVNCQSAKPKDNSPVENGAPDTGSNAL
ncbi:MAG: hypothetical protein ACXVBE_07485 [Bdellovibrionota bacterium]